jgi:hypothetical protein
MLVQHTKLETSKLIAYLFEEIKQQYELLTPINSLLLSSSSKEINNDNGQIADRY